MSKKPDQNNEKFKRNGNGKGKGRNDKNNGNRNDNNSGDEKLKKSHNNVTWFGKNPLLLEAAGKMSFNNPLGLPVSLLENGEVNIGTETEVSTGDTIIPGIAVLRCIPTVGVSKDGASDVNNASRQIYAFVRHANSGSRNYEAPDYMTYLIAMRSAYDFYSEMVRLYGLCMIYSHTNRYIGKALIEALGYNYEDITRNLASLRYYINQYAIKINTYAVPKELTYYDRGAFVPMHIFKDCDDDKAGLYAMQYDKYFFWNGTRYETGSACILHNRPEGTLDNIIQFGDDLIANLMTNEDIGIMSGDTLKAFGESGLRTVNGIDEKYVTLPVYDAMVLEQIHNTTFCGADISQTDVKQLPEDEESVIVWSPRIEMSIPLGTILSKTTPILDAKESNPAASYVMEITRNMFSYDAFDVNVSQFSLDSCGSELFTTLDIYSIDLSDGGVLQDPITSANCNGILLNDAINTVALANVLIRKQYFDMAPFTYVFADFNSDDTYRCYPAGEIFNYTPISKSTLRKLHNCALLSLFNISGLGKSV